MARASAAAEGALSSAFSSSETSLPAESTPEEDPPLLSPLIFLNCCLDGRACIEGSSVSISKSMLFENNAGGKIVLDVFAVWQRFGNKFVS